MKSSRPGLQTAKKKRRYFSPNLYIIFDQKSLNLLFSVELIHLEWFKGGYTGMYTILLNCFTEKKNKQNSPVLHPVTHK